MLVQAHLNIARYANVSEINRRRTPLDGHTGTHPPFGSTLMPAAPLLVARNRPRGLFFLVQSLEGLYPSVLQGPSHPASPRCDGSADAPMLLDGQQNYVP